MERLSFAEMSGYNGLEASIHLARYALVRELCKGKSILDLACGEGYGSRLLAEWGAARVVGVDVSRDAIEQARALFATPRVDYRLADANALMNLFPEERFDLIVSLETIEHVEAPEQLLRDFQRLLKPGGVLALSCPNDWWYYPSAQESNPYHRRKYTFEEFRTMAQTVLGSARAWYFGGPHAGFINVRIDARQEADAFSTQALMLHASEIEGSMALPAERSMGPTETTASYFAGFWTADANVELGSFLGAATLPLSMDAFRHGFFAQTADTVHQLRQQLTEARELLVDGASESVFGIEDASLAIKLDRVQKLHADLTSRTADFDLAEDLGNKMVDSRLRYALLREQACELEKEIIQTRFVAATRRIASLERDEARALQQETWLRQTLLVTRAESDRAKEELLRARDAESQAQDQIHRWASHAETLLVEAQRYRRIRDAIPASFRHFGMKLLRIAKRIGK